MSGAPGPIRILIADDEPAVRDVLSELLAYSDGLEVVGEAKDTAETVELAAARRPDVVLLDVRMREAGGPAATRQILARDPSIRVVALSAHADHTTILEMLEAGAVGYVVKGAPHEQVLASIRCAVRGEATIPTDTLRRLVERRGAGSASVPSAHREETLDPARRRRQFRQVVRVQEEERRRIAADIHDDSLQIMSVAAMRLGMLRDRMADPTDREAVDQARASVQRAVQRLRQLLFELRPRTLDVEGLVPAVETYLEETLEGSGISYEVRSDLGADPPDEVRAVLYRIVQEAVTNARKHSGASSLRVELETRDGGATARVTDDGKGFSPDDVQGGPAPTQLGLTSMRERAEMADGRFRVTSVAGEGTTVEAWLPGSESGS